MLLTGKLPELEKINLGICRKDLLNPLVCKMLFSAFITSTDNIASTAIVMINRLMYILFFIPINLNMA